MPFVPDQIGEFQRLGVAPKTAGCAGFPTLYIGQARACHVAPWRKRMAGHACAGGLCTACEVPFRASGCAEGKRDPSPKDRGSASMRHQAVPFRGQRSFGLAGERAASHWHAPDIQMMVALIATMTLRKSKAPDQSIFRFDGSLRRTASLPSHRSSLLCCPEALSGAISRSYAMSAGDEDIRDQRADIRARWLPFQPFLVGLGGRRASYSRRGPPRPPSM